MLLQTALFGKGPYRKVSSPNEQGGKNPLMVDLSMRLSL
jgi:hypothetical protein